MQDIITWQKLDEWLGEQPELVTLAVQKLGSELIGMDIHEDTAGAFLLLRVHDESILNEREQELVIEEPLCEPRAVRAKFVHVPPENRFKALAVGA